MNLADIFILIILAVFVVAAVVFLHARKKKGGCGCSGCSGGCIGCEKSGKRRISKDSPRTYTSFIRRQRTPVERQGSFAVLCLSIRRDGSEQNRKRDWGAVILYPEERRNLLPQCVPSPRFPHRIRRFFRPRCARCKAPVWQFQ